MKRIFETGLFIFALLVAAVVIANRFPTAGTLAQAVPPSVVVQADPSLRLASYLPMTAVSTELFSFKISSATSTEPVRIDRVTLFVTSTPAWAGAASSTPTLKNFQLFMQTKAGEVASAVIPRGEAYPTIDNARVNFNGLNMVIAPSSTARFVLRADVSSLPLRAVSNSKHKVFLPARYTNVGPPIDVIPTIQGTGVNTGIRAGVIASNLSGNQHTVFTSVLHVSVSPTSPSGLSTPSSEQVVAIYNLTREVPYSRYPQPTYVSIYFSAAPPSVAVRQLWIYKDSVVAANRVGGYAFAPGESLSRGINLTPFNLESASPRQLIFTFDTSAARVNDKLWFNLQGLRWSDTITGNIPNLDIPPTGMLAGLIKY